MGELYDEAAMERLRQHFEAVDAEASNEAGEKSGIVAREIISLARMKPESEEPATRVLLIDLEGEYPPIEGEI